METKIIPFDLETAKKIQAGEIKGKIKTRDGRREMNIVCDNSTAIYGGDKQSIIAQDINDSSYLSAHFENGSYLDRRSMVSGDLILVLEVQDIEPRLKPFDKVLCRDHNEEVWRANLFSHEACDLSYPYYVCGGSHFKQCIPYEGNEHLIGTTNMPKK